MLENIYVLKRTKSLIALEFVYLGDSGWDVLGLT